MNWTCRTSRISAANSASEGPAIMRPLGSRKKSEVRP